MNPSDLLNHTLDQIKNADPVGDLARHLVKAGVKEEALVEALKQRGYDLIAIDLHRAFLAVTDGSRSVNRCGVVRETGKEYKIRVHMENGDHCDYVVTANDETDARVTAAAMNGGLCDIVVDRAEIERVKKFTEVL